MYTKEQMLEVITKAEAVYDKVFAEMKEDIAKWENLDVVMKLMPKLVEQRLKFNKFREEKWL